MTEPAKSMLALLIAQAEGKSADMIALRALIEEASEAGAERALGAIGLKDANAGADMRDLRELLQAWRDAKKSAWNAVVTWLVRIFLAVLVAGMAVKMGLFGGIR
jgi:Family of unknown function (DUF6127)